VSANLSARRMARTPHRTGNPFRRAALLAGLALLTACELVEPTEPPAVPPPATPPAAAHYQAVPVAELPGWDGDAMGDALPALRGSCERIAALPAARLMGPMAGTAGDWQPLCAVLPQIVDGSTLRKFIELNFVALRVRDTANGDTGLITGYFEPVVEAARDRAPTYAEPIYAVPRDHVTVPLGDFDPALKGRAVIGRVEAGRLVPYRDRGEIHGGALAGHADVLFWARDPLDVFILQVQGSGIVTLPDGTRTRIGFAGHNGHDYVSVGRHLLATGALPDGRAGWEDIRAWLEANPDRARDILAVNRRFIFFRETGGEGPFGAAGVVLTPGRSLAVDPGFVPLNAPVWLDAENPVGGDRLRRLMFAQDTGNAIRGVVRGDYYWGTGRAALASAGRMKSAGKYWILVPKTIAPTS
jgi:membrane-bound lytic murein transglycosylase A